MAIDPKDVPNTGTPGEKLWTWIKGDNPVKPVTPPSKLWIWIKGDNPILPLSATELAIQRKMSQSWTWIKGDNPVKRKSQRKATGARPGIRNKNGKLMEKFKDQMKRKLPNLRGLARKSKEGRRGSVAGGNGDGERRTESGDDLAAVPHNHASSEVSSLSSSEVNDDDGPSPPDYVSQVQL